MTYITAESIINRNKGQNNGIYKSIGFSEIVFKIEANKQQVDLYNQ